MAPLKISDARKEKGTSIFIGEGRKNPRCIPNGLIGIRRYTIERRKEWQRKKPWNETSCLRSNKEVMKLLFQGEALQLRSSKPTRRLYI